MLPQLRPLLACGLLTATAVAAADPIVNISAQFRGEHITHYHDTSLVRTTVYLTNHEPYSVICDAEMKTSYEEKTKKPETTIAPGQTQPFIFKYNKSVTHLQVYLMCKADEAQKAIVDEKGKLEGSNIEKTSDNVTTRKLEPKENTEVKVKEEDLGQF